MRTTIFSWLFFISIYSLSFFIGVSVVCAQCPEDQKSLLLQLKNSLKFNANLSKNLVQWDQNADHCNWSGVMCSEGCVISLDLSNERISGGIDNSSSLFGLRHIQNLNLGYNNFDSTIPAGFAKLSNLSVLNMSNAGFVGQIPIEISNLTQLVTLDFSTSAYLQGASKLKLENPNLKSLVQNLKQLRELYLDGINISARGAEWCQALSSSLPNLSVLSLFGCYLSGPIDSSLANIRSLSVIRLDNNNLSSQVPEFFADFSNLTSLRLTTCGLSGSFPARIFQVPTLRTIDLSNNRQLQGHLPSFPLNSSLQTLVLQGTGFSGALPDSIGNLKKLSRIDLKGCGFNGSIPNTIADLGELLFFDLSSNRFEGEIPSFSFSKRLTVLNIAHNQLNGSIDSTKWDDLVSLVNLDLRNNSLTGRILSSLFTIPLIQKIQLSQNRFSGSLHGLSNLSSSPLDTLDLGSNDLGGPFPISVFKLQSLKILTLPSNNFTGTIQLDMISQLRNLTSLDLSSNSLLVDANDTEFNSTSSSFPQLSTLKLASCKLRTFPAFLKNQSKLNFLDLSSNELRGNIPNWIWELDNLLHLNVSCNFLVGLKGPLQNHSSHLLVLDLHSNELQGPIPILPSIAAYLDYSHNKFSSIIPAYIGNYIEGTVFFSLSSNNIHGFIPISICNSTSLQVLDLSDNSLSGPIPQCLTRMTTNLGVLNLRNNNFSGFIYDTFPPSCGLRTLDLSGNQIEGQVPKSLANCTMLEVLDLGKNRILDSYPCPLKSISSLRVLVLRSNQFYGKIGCPHINGTWPSLQIVDLAENNFSGELPGICLTTWKGMMADEDSAESKLKHLRFKVLKFTDVSYQDTITVTSKGLEMELVKILTVFTSIDFSSNHFQGPIPDEIMELKGLYILNLSHNAFTDQIPSSIGNLIQLESLDLSNNKLAGAIPAQLALLNFLSFLNLSNNQLAGRIPTGNQLQTFSSDSYVGNKALCGPPLTNTCDDSKIPASTPTFLSTNSGIKFDWQLIYIGMGFGVGAAAAVAPLIFWERGIKWSDEIVDKILLVILPMLGMVYTTTKDMSESEDDTHEELAFIAGDYEDDEDETEEEYRGQYCVFCSKLDIFRKRAIHDPKCTCHYSILLSSFSSSSSSLS